MPPVVAMKRKTYDYDSSTEDGSPTSLDGADYTDQGWTTRGGSDWRSFTWAFGLGPSSSSSTSVFGRRRRGGRRGASTATAAKGKTAAGTPRAASGGDETDPMKELLEIVLWNAGEEEIDITAGLEADAAAVDYDSDDEEIACFKRLAAIDREQTIRPRGVAPPVHRAKSGGKARREEGGGNKASTSTLLSVSSLRFDSLLRLDTSTTTLTSSSKTSMTSTSRAGGGGEKSSILRLEQRTTTMERAFKGVLEDAYTSPSSSASAKPSSATSPASPSSKVTSSAPAAGDEENFWDDVEF